ncbi:MAG: CcmD family protein [Terriglobia bacterium]
MTNSNNTYLFLAYSLVWIVFMIYAWSLARRQSRMRRELEELKASVPKSETAVPPARE